MATDMSIVFKAQDSLTQEVQKMRESVKKMGKDVADYKAIQDKAFKEKAELQLDFRKAKDELKELAKLEKDGVEGSKEAYINKQKQINEMQEGIKRYNQVINEANKAEKELTTTRSRNNNNPNNIKNNNNANNTPNMAKQLVQAGMLRDLGNSIGNYAGATLTSRYGDRLGNSIGNGISSTISGAMMGASVGGVPGAVGGAAIGATKGVIDYFTEEKKDKDKYFKENVKGIYDKVTEMSSKGLDNGIELGKQRENDIIAFKNLLGDKSKANKFLNDTEKMASVTPFTQTDLLQLGKGMMTYGYKQNEILPNLTKLGDAFSALGVDQEGKKASVTALGRMKSSGKASLENINILQDKGIDAVGILAAKMETSKQQVYKMISKGAIDGADAVRVITEAVGKKYKGAMEEFSKTTEGLESTLSDMKDKGDRAEGEGYNKERKKGLEAEIAYLEKVKVEDRKYIGEYKASLKNKEEELMRSTIESTKQSEEYRKAVASGDGAEVGKLLADAQTKAIVEWNNSPEMKQVHESELARVRATQMYVSQNADFLSWGRQMADQFNMGWDSTIRLNLPKNESATPPTTPPTTSPTNGRFDVPKPRAKIDAFSGRFATGTIRVPYDNYPALLHEGERVLTARETQQMDNKDKSNNNVINININNDNSNADELANKVAFKITQALENLA